MYIDASNACMEILESVSDDSSSRCCEGTSEQKVEHERAVQTKTMTNN
jgi:hypothetical protein